MNGTVSEAIGHALVDLGADVITQVPGRGIGDTVEKIATLTSKNIPISFNEETAYSIAHSAAILGKRSAVMMKSHGFMKAGNAATDSLYVDVTAGFVVLIFEDKDGSHSDNVLEIEPILKGIPFPYKIADETNIYEEVIGAYRESEKRQIPFALLIDSAKTGNNVEFEKEVGVKKEFIYKRNITAHIVHPMFAGYQFKKFKAKTLGGDVTTIPPIDIPQYPQGLSENYQTASKKYATFFDVFKDFRGEVVTGDTSVSSSFALPPYNAIDIITHIGGSVPLAIGAYLAGRRDVWAMTGDFGFLASGHLGLLEIIEREIPIKIVIFYNKAAAATGGQIIHKKLMYRLLAGYDNSILQITNPRDFIEIGEVLNEAKNSNEMKIILANY
ncbi:MAG: hypothetical protein GXO87_10955 [Chlorobi bacterium]|nr:hypothetical protein [Chlorobiota bacterium]